MKRPELVIIDAPTLLDGMAELLHQAWAEWWLQEAGHQRLLVEALHQHTTADVVVTPDSAWWL